MIADCWALFVYANIAKIMNSKACGKCFNHSKFSNSPVGIIVFLAVCKQKSLPACQMCRKGFGYVCVVLVFPDMLFLHAELSLLAVYFFKRALAFLLAHGRFAGLPAGLLA